MGLGQMGLDQMGLDQMGLDKVGIHQLTCTVAVKGVTVVKEVHTKEVQEGVVAKKCKKGKKISKICVCKYTVHK